MQTTKNTSTPRKNSFLDLFTNQPIAYDDPETVPFIHQDPTNIEIEQELLIEPQTHVKNKSFASRYYCKCCSNERRTRLTTQELIRFYSLKAECNLLFDPEEEEHNLLVNDLWCALTGEPALDDIPNEQWKQFGFQNRDPRTDFRGSGVAGLKMLVNYARDYPSMIKCMSNPNDDFLFAVSSINVTYFLLKYFHLADFLEYERDKEELGSRKALKNFCVILSKDEDAFCKFHDILFTDLHGVWVDFKKKTQGVTILDFKVCMDEIKRKLKKALNNDYYDSFVQFQVKYSEITNWNGRTPKLARLY